VDREVADLCLWVDVWEMESITLTAPILRLRGPSPISYTF
jgi:hypothetical protein